MLKWLPRLLVVWLASLAAEEALPQVTADAFGRRPTAELATEVLNAAADQLYAVTLGFGRPTSVGDIRTMSAQLGIPRVLAYVEYAYSVGGQGRGLVILGLGEVYAPADARQYSECRAHVMVNLSGQSQLRNSPIDAWPVSKIHLYGTAHLIREPFGFSASFRRTRL